MEYGSLREKIAAEGKARKERYAKFAAVYEKAVAAGLAAGQAAVPVAMVVREEVPATGRSWYVSEGICGFAWVNVYPGNSSFALWLKKNGHASKAYQGGMQVWVSEFGQSMQRKEAYAAAMAETFRNELGVKAYSGSRMD